MNAPVPRWLWLALLCAVAWSLWDRPARPSSVPGYDPWSPEAAFAEMP